MYKVYVTDDETEVGNLIERYVDDAYSIKYHKEGQVSLVKESERVMIIDEILGDVPYEWACGLQCSLISIDIELSPYALLYWRTRVRGVDSKILVFGKELTEQQWEYISVTYKESKNV